MNERKLIWYDLETTDKDVLTARAIRLYAIRNDGGILDLWINPTVPIKAEASEVNGITDDMVKDKPTFKDLSQKIYNFFVGCDLGGYNIIGFDNIILDLELQRCGLELPMDKVLMIDPLLIWRKYEEKHLTDASRRFLGVEMTDAHNPDADVNTTRKVFEAMDNLWLQGKTLEEIHKEITDGRVDADGKLIKIGDKIVINFGKYKDQLLEDIQKKDWQYLDWVVNKSEMSGSLKYHLKKLMR